MKKKNIAKILIATILFTGCNTFNKKPTDPINQPAVIERDESVKELPYDPVSLIEYINQNIEKVDKDKKELYLFTLEDTLISNLNIVGGVVNSEEFKSALAFLNDGETLKDSDIDSIKDDAIKNEVIKIYNMYYVINKSGDTLVPNLNYNKFLDLIKDNQVLKEYYSIKQEENDNPTLFKGVMQLSAKELLDRINTIENFIVNHKTFSRNTDFISRYQSWLYVLLTGTTLSPIVDGNGKLIDSYQELSEKLEPKTIADRAFLDGVYIIKKKASLDDEVLGELRSVVRDAVFEIKDKVEMK